MTPQLPSPQTPPSNQLARNAIVGLLALLLGALIFLVGVSVGVAASRGFSFPGSSPFAQSQRIDGTPGITRTASLNIPQMTDVMARLKTQFYGDFPTDDTLTDGALRGLVATFGDQFTQYVDPKFAKIIEQDSAGQFEGVGATLRAGKNGGGVQIIRVFDGSPAAKGGVQNGDFIQAVNGVRVTELGVNEVAALVRGTRGTTVTVSIRREPQPKPFDLILTRDRIVIPVVTSKIIEAAGGKIAYAQLNDFSANSAAQLTEAIDGLLKQNPRGLVLDLRNNGGGLLDQATKIGDLFLKEGVFIIQRDYSGKEERRSTTDTGIAQDIPMVVLVNNGSASAAEVLAGAIQDYKRGTLIGEQTFGKGSVQLPQSLPNGGQLRITIQHWFTPLNRGIHGVGIAPDYVVPRTLDDERANKDPQLDAALALLLEGKAP